MNSLPINNCMKWYNIYQIRNKINDKCYIGSAVKILDRWWLHKKMLRNGNHHSVKLQRAWDKYGENNFAFEHLNRGLEREMTKEVFYLRMSLTDNDYICTKPTIFPIQLSKIHL